METRLKKKASKIKEIEATVQTDGRITYSDELGTEKEYIVDNMEDYRWAVSECAVSGKNAFEVSHRLFDALTHGKDTPYLITGNPAVYIYREGTMERTKAIQALDIEDLLELKAKKAKKDAELAKAQKDKLKKEIEL